MLDWLSSGKGATIPELLAKKKYAQAIALLQDELKRRPHDERVQMQLAEVYVLDGKKDPAVRILTALADDLAERGFAAKAIAVLKKVQKIDPGQHVEQKLARLIRESRGEPTEPPRATPSMGAAIDLGFPSLPGDTPKATPVATPPRPAVATPPPPPPKPAPVAPPPVIAPEPEPLQDFAIGAEPVEDFAIGMQSSDEMPAFLRPPEVELPEAPVIDFVMPEPELESAPVIDFVEPEPEPVIDFVEAESAPVIDFVEAEPEPVIDFIVPEESETAEATFAAEEAEPQPAPSDIDAALAAALPDDSYGSEQPIAAPALEQPRPTQKKIALFADFSADDLTAVIQEFDLRSFSPGDIVLTEGEGGDSLFVIASGALKAYVRQPDGRNQLTREMSEGDFFGEVALLTGQPRTATIVAASACDLLELNKTALDRIATDHPNVRQVLLRFYHERAQTATQSAVEEIEIEETPPEAVEQQPSVQEEAPIVVQLEEPVVPEVSEEEQRELRAVTVHDAALSATRANQWAEALPLWKEYVELKPDDLQAMSVIGIVSGKLELWEEAVNAFRLAIKHAPKDATIYFNLGFAYGKTARWPEAVYAYEQAVRIKPDYDKAKQSLARASAQLKGGR